MDEDRKMVQALKKDSYPWCGTGLRERNRQSASVASGEKKNRRLNRELTGTQKKKICVKVGR